MKTDVTVVILAAGLGTRMKSRKAKVLHEAGGLALIEHVLESALRIADADRIAVVVGHQAGLVQERLSGKGVRFAFQTEQKGTGHALAVCRDVVPGTHGLLVVLYGDCPLLSAQTLECLLERHRSSGAAATVITTLLDDPTGYGRAITDENGFIQAIVEEKVATAGQKSVKQINSGMYCFDASLLWKHLPEIQPNPVSQEYYLTDIVEILNGAGHRVAAMLHPDASELLGINNRVELAAVDRIFRERKVRDLMLAGVTVIKPETVTVDADVEIGIDSVVEPFAQLLGKTRVGEDCRIGTGSIVSDSTLADGVQIAPYTIVNKSEIGARASIGPFARLRTDNHIAPEAHIGNFVELKKTKFGEGSKAGHLAYLGDSEIGDGCNIGAGAITCNYDGSRKYQTTISDRTFVGSNATLVAPVELGAGSYIAAGSVITENVPSDALGIGRERQTNKEGWARKRKQAASATDRAGGR
jgi:bifunctional UDP-N-acetylglucosamine pyrophosphorylase/glucosamine-1-phosphate N-acetyltransferase